MKIGLWSSTPASNSSTPPDGWPEGQAPSTVNDCAREMMAAVRTYCADAQWFDHGMSPTYINATSFSVPGSQGAILEASRKLKFYGATTNYGTIVTASASAASTTVVFTGTTITAQLSSFAVSILSNTNNALPPATIIAADAIVKAEGVEGGQLLFEVGTGSLVTGSYVNMDFEAGIFRIFESAGTLRGAYLALTECAAGVTSKIDTFPSGTRLPFAQAAAPTGWTQDTTDSANNRMLRFTTGAGNGVAGTHSPILNNVVPSHTHNFTTGGVTSDHTHNYSGNTGTESALHTHSQVGSGTGGATTGNQIATNLTGSLAGVEQTGSESALHYHGYSGITSGISTDHGHAGNTDNGSSQTNWQPRYIDMILCTKN